MPTAKIYKLECLQNPHIRLRAEHGPAEGVIRYYNKRQRGRCQRGRRESGAAAAERSRSRPAEDSEWRLEPRGRSRGCRGRSCRRRPCPSPGRT